MVLLFTLWCVLKHLGFFPRQLNITELPYDALQHIFTHIPLVDLLGSVPEVSPSWAEHTSDTLRTRRSLALKIGGLPDFSYLCYLTELFWPKDAPAFRDTAYLTSRAYQLSESAVGQLIGCLPPIETLFLYLRKPTGPFSEPILTLLTHWSPTLRHLLIIVEKEDEATASDNHEKTSTQCLTLLGSLEPLRKLVTLVFIYEDSLLPPNAQEQTVNPGGELDLPILRHLEYFNLHTGDETDRLLGPSYLRYLPEARPSLSGLEWFTCTSTPLTGRHSLLEFSPAVARQFTDVRIPFWEEANLFALDRLLDRFSNLSRLTLPLTSQLSLASLVASIRRSLSSLDFLLIYFDRSPGLAAEISAIERIVDLEAVSLVTVKTLRLIYLTFNSHRDLEALQLHRLFPSVEKLCFFQDGFNCRICGDEDNSELHLDTFARCLVELTHRFEHLFVKEIPKIHLHAQGEMYLLNPQADPPLINDTYL